MVILMFCIITLLMLMWIFLIRCGVPRKEINSLAGYRYAHRGLHDISQGIPENSMAAFRKAAQLGYGVELDVHLSKDGRLIIMHDGNLLRMTGIDKNLDTMTWEELRQIKLANTNQTIPLLDEVLPLFINKAPVIIELKSNKKDRAALCKAACALVDTIPITYCMESFDPFIVKWLKENRPDIVRGQLSEDFIHHPGTLSRLEAFVLTNLLMNFLTRPDFIAYDYRYRNNLSFRLCQKLWHPAKVSWTLKSAEVMAETEKEGCLSIFEGFLPNPKINE